MYGNEVTPTKILENPKLMLSFNHKAYTTLEFIKNTHSNTLKPEGVYDIKWIAYYNHKRAAQLLLTPDSDDAWVGSSLLWSSFSDQAGETDFLSLAVDQVNGISDVTPHYDEPFMDKLEKLAASAPLASLRHGEHFPVSLSLGMLGLTVNCNTDRRIPWADDIKDLYTASMQIGGLWTALLPLGFSQR